jgi:biopolymer transport protein ExbB
MWRVLAAALVAIVSCTMPSTAHAWWNDEWNFRKELTLDLTPQGADIAGSPADVPVLVRLSLGNFEFWSDAKPDGSDLRVVLGDDKTPLKFHVERWDANGQMAFIWVRMPRLAGGAATDKLFLYYGNPSAPSGSEPAASFDANQALVFHFSEADGTPQDATAYATGASASTAERVPGSLIGGGLRFGGAQSVTVPSNSALRLATNGGMTISAWVRTDQPTQDAVIAALEGPSGSLMLGLRGGRPYARLQAGTPVEVQSGADLPAASWHHVALRIGDGQLSVLLDGTEVGSAAARPIDLGGTLTIGATGAGAGSYTGDLDEFQVSNVARSTDWLRAAVRSQGIDAKLVVYGGDAQKEGGHTSYFGTIAKNLTVDGWVVIVICFVMLLIALFIMALKAIYLGRVESANRKFIKEFEALKGDTRALDRAETEEQREFAEKAPTMAAISGEGGAYGASSLYSLYHVGVRELNKRVSTSVGARRVETLSPQSVEAIRAALDATATRLQQQLSAQMVLLTIAISGGPFLGLLGTVIGVMITFAAIAASGDVNVNAIAPGTAAALAATVAGLAVAIPALFGYNWLNTRIKAINADNRVFVDEFVARMAEQYS